MAKVLRCKAERVDVMGLVEDPDTYPIQPKPHSMEFCVRTRTCVHAPTSWAPLHVPVTRLRKTIHRFFHEQDFFWVNTPILTASDCEGAGEMFRVSTLDMMNFPKTPEGKPDFSKDFFGKETFLTVSGQLNVETYCMAFYPRSTPSAQPFARKTPTPAVTWLSSG